MIFNLKYLLLFTFWIINSDSGYLNKPAIQNDSNIIFDCNYTFEEAIAGIEIPKSIIKQLTLIEVEYYSFDEKLHHGQIIGNQKAAKDIKEIFEFIKSTKFPIAKVIPVVKYNWSDEASMNDNNT